MDPFYSTPDFRQAYQGYQAARRSSDLTTSSENEMDMARQNYDNQNAADAWGQRNAALRASVPDYRTPEHQAINVQRMAHQFSAPRQTRLAGYDDDGNMLSQAGDMSPYQMDRERRSAAGRAQMDAMDRGGFTGTEEAMLNNPAFQNMEQPHREAAFRAAHRGNSLQDYHYAKDAGMNYGEYQAQPAQRKFAQEYLSNFEKQFGRAFAEVDGGQYDKNTGMYAFPDKVVIDEGSGERRVTPGGSLRIDPRVVDEARRHYNNVMNQNSPSIASAQARAAELEQKEKEDEAKRRAVFSTSAPPAPPAVDTRTDGQKIRGAIGNIPYAINDAVTPNAQYNPNMDATMAFHPMNLFGVNVSNALKWGGNVLATGSGLYGKDPFTPDQQFRYNDPRDNQESDNAYWDAEKQARLLHRKKLEAQRAAASR